MDTAHRVVIEEMVSAGSINFGAAGNAKRH